MTRPRSVTAAAGLAGLAAGLTALLWTATDFASTTPGTPPPPPSPPEGVSQAEWDRVLASAASSTPPDPEPMTNLELFSRLFEGGLMALAVAGVVLWLVVAVAAARGLGWARHLALIVAAGQAMALPALAAGSSPAVLAVTWAVVVTGLTSAALLWRTDSTAHAEETSGTPAAAAPVA